MSAPSSVDLRPTPAPVTPSRLVEAMNRVRETPNLAARMTPAPTVPVAEYVQRIRAVTRPGV